MLTWSFSLSFERPTFQFHSNSEEITSSCCSILLVSLDVWTWHIGDANSEVHAFLDPADGRALVHMDFTIANIMWDPTSLNLQLGVFFLESFLGGAKVLKFPWGLQNCQKRTTIGYASVGSHHSGIFAMQTCGFFVKLPLFFFLATAKWSSVAVKN